MPGIRERVAAGLRSSRLGWLAYNLLHYRELRRNAEHYRRLGVDRSVIGTISHRDIKRAANDPPWLDRPDAVEALERSDKLDSFPEPVQDALRRWPEDGFMVLNGWLDPQHVDEINAELERLFERGTVKYHPLGKRIMNAHEHCEPISRVVHDPELKRLLGFVLGRDVTLFQTIDFFVGSQQDAHSDSFHMTTEPMGYLIAIWVALEDVDADAGPLFYYPGSHRLRYVMTEDLLAEPLAEQETKEDRYARRIAGLVSELGLEPVEFHARKGDVLVWHANLLHGGRAISRPGATRRSLVAHYFGKGVLCYHEVTERPALVKS